MLPQVIERTEWKKPQIHFDQNNQWANVNRVMKNWGITLVTQMLRVFVDTAARFTPPNIGKANIENKYYYRPVQELAKLAKGEYPPYHATRADFAALRQGFKFRVLNTKVGHKKNEVYAYCKGINEAKRLSRIKNRGLARYTWGSALNNHTKEIFEEYAKTGGKIVETDLPPIFHRLAKKSPNITKYHFGWSKASYHKGKNAYAEVQVTNKLSEAERYSTIAIDKGTKAVEVWVNRFFGKVKKGLEEDIYKLVNDAKVYRVRFK